MKKFTFLFSICLAFTFFACSESSDSAATQAADTAEQPAKAKTVAAEKSKAKTGYDIGDLATDFSLKNIDGKMVSLSDFADAKGFILTFTCNHCPYSVAYEDRLVALDKKYKSQGYPVIAINPNNPESYPEDSFDKMKVRAKEKAFTFPYLFDDGQKIFPQYGATKTPHMFILQKMDNGNRVEYIGAIDDNTNDAAAVKQKYVEAAVNALLEGKEPEVRKTKAIGCSIKV